MFEIKIGKLIKTAKDRNEIIKLVFTYLAGTHEFLMKTVDKLHIKNIEKPNEQNTKQIKKK